MKHHGYWRLEVFHDSPDPSPMMMRWQNAGLARKLRDHCQAGNAKEQAGVSMGRTPLSLPPLASGTVYFFPDLCAPKSSTQALLHIRELGRLVRHGHGRAKFGKGKGKLKSRKAPSQAGLAFVRPSWDGRNIHSHRHLHRFVRVPTKLDTSRRCRPGPRDIVPLVGVGEGGARTRALEEDFPMTSTVGN